MWNIKWLQQCGQWFHSEALKIALSWRRHIVVVAQILRRHNSIDWDKPFKVTHMSDLQTERDKLVLFFYLPLKSHRHQEKPKKQIFSRMQLFMRDLLIVTCTIPLIHQQLKWLVLIVATGYIFNISYKMLWMCPIRKKSLCIF